MEVWPNHVYDGMNVQVRIKSSVGPPPAKHISGQTTAAWNWCLVITEVGADAKVVRKLTFPIVVGKAQVSVDPATLPEGLYRVQPSLIGPDGSAQRVWYKPKPPRQTYTADRFLQIHRGPAPTIATRVIDSPHQLTRRRRLGNPGHPQYPSDEVTDCHGRSIWDLQLHRGRVYAGIGVDGGVTMSHLAEPKCTAWCLYSRDLCLPKIPYLLIYRKLRNIPGYREMTKLCLFS